MFTINEPLLLCVAAALFIFFVWGTMYIRRIDREIRDAEFDAVFKPLYCKEIERIECNYEVYVKI